MEKRLRTKPCEVCEEPTAIRVRQTKWWKPLARWRWLCVEDTMAWLDKTNK